MRAKGSAMLSMSVAGSTPSLKVLCWLGFDRNCVSRTRPSFKVEAWRWGWRKSRNQSLPRASKKAFCWLVRSKDMMDRFCSCLWRDIKVHQTLICPLTHLLEGSLSWGFQKEWVTADCAPRWGSLVQNSGLRKQDCVSAGNICETCHALCAMWLCTQNLPGERSSSHIMLLSFTLLGAGRV